MSPIFYTEGDKKAEEKFFVLMRQIEENSFVRAEDGTAVNDKRGFSTGWSSVSTAGKRVWSQ